MHIMDYALACDTFNRRRYHVDYARVQIYTMPSDTDIDLAFDIELCRKMCQRAKSVMCLIVCVSFTYVIIVICVPSNIYNTNSSVLIIVLVVLSMYI